MPLFPLFECLPPAKLLDLFAVVLTERQVVFISQQHSLLTAAIQAIISLMYPLAWPHALIPILPRQLIGVLEAPNPFICGLPTSYLKDCSIQQETVKVYLDEGKIDFGSDGSAPGLPDSLRKKLLQHISVNAPTFTLRPNNWKTHRLPLFDDAFCAITDHSSRQFPVPVRSAAERAKGPLKSATWTLAPGQREVVHDRKLRAGFLNFFVSILQGYRRFLIFGSPDNPDPLIKFRFKDFLKSLPAEWQAFMRPLCETQAFSQFIDERILQIQRSADVIFFDEAVDAKISRTQSRKGDELPSSALSGAARTTKTYVPPSPDLTMLPEALAYHYPRFPRLASSLFSTPRNLAASLCAKDQAESSTAPLKRIEKRVENGRALDAREKLSANSVANGKKISSTVTSDRACVYSCYLVAVCQLVSHARSRLQASKRAGHTTNRVIANYAPIPHLPAPMPRSDEPEHDYAVANQNGFSQQQRASDETITSLLAFEEDHASPRRSALDLLAESESDLDTSTSSALDNAGHSSSASLAGLSAISLALEAAESQGADTASAGTGASAKIRQALDFLLDEDIPAADSSEKPLTESSAVVSHGPILPSPPGSPPSTPSTPQPPLSAPDTGDSDPMPDSRDRAKSTGSHRSRVRTMSSASSGTRDRADSAAFWQVREEAVTAAAKLGLRVALEVLNCLSKQDDCPEDVVYRALMEACGMCGEGAAAVDLMALLQEESIMPDKAMLAAAVQAVSTAEGGSARIDGAEIWTTIDWRTLQRRRGADAVSCLFSRKTKGFGVVPDLRPTVKIDKPAAAKGVSTAKQAVSSGSEIKSLEMSPSREGTVTAPTSSGTRSPVRKNGAASARLSRQMAVAEALLEQTFPGLVIDLAHALGTQCPGRVSAPCPAVRPLTLSEIGRGWSPGDPNSYTTKCCHCGMFFVPRFSVWCPDPLWVGSDGIGTPLWCELLSPWTLKKELFSVLLVDGVHALAALSKEFHDATKTSDRAVVFWNALVAFRSKGLPFTFLLAENDMTVIFPPPITNTIGATTTPTRA